mmetsp:Transcript_50809/g.99342  ORF Transcript_50809/g.99342 Transcript_50809/m.99342 type:complete len:243 (-) Transcript_50809:1678-2406(-)
MSCTRSSKASSHSGCTSSPPRNSLVRLGMYAEKSSGTLPAILSTSNSTDHRWEDQKSLTIEKIAGTYGRRCSRTIPARFATCCSRDSLSACWSHVRTVSRMCGTTSRKNRTHRSPRLLTMNMSDVMHRLWWFARDGSRSIAMMAPMVTRGKKSSSEGVKRERLDCLYGWATMAYCSYMYRCAGSALSSKSNPFAAPPRAPSGRGTRSVGRECARPPPKGLPPKPSVGAEPMPRTTLFRLEML